GLLGFLNRIIPIFVGYFVVLFGQSGENGTKECMRRLVDLGKKSQPLMRMFDNQQWELWPETVKKMPFYLLQSFITK
ncbi:hypothetical protein Goklo_029157, partial [Gossypium klotzschianum]|nr:hypothetical protein [Gossypium klotzschianum]